MVELWWPEAAADVMMCEMEEMMMWQCLIGVDVFARINAT